MEEKHLRKHNNEEDQTASSRKSDHIELAFNARVESEYADRRFAYEPMMSGHPSEGTTLPIEWLGYTMNYPIWVSSMTGGTEKAKQINKNLATICGEYGFGMGLGSCRQLLYENSRLEEFDVKELMPDQPLMINLGIAQVEEMIASGEVVKIRELIQRLNADGLIIHINPLQEWMQPEGDRFKKSPIDTIKTLLSEVDYHIIVKEVGQGFGMESLKALLSLPIAALDLAGFGGTNFSKLELLRSDQIRYDSFKDIFKIGHTCEEMIENINKIVDKSLVDINCNKIIASGGISNFLDGYYYINKCKLPTIYAQASAFLNHAMNINNLRKHVELQVEGLLMANTFLRTNG